MVVQESYIKLTTNEHGQIQPELFISGEFDILNTVEQFKNLRKTLKDKGFSVVETDLHFEVKQMSGWKQITVRGSDITEVENKFVELSTSGWESAEDK